MPMESFLSEETKAKLTDKFGFLANSFDHRVLSVLALACDEGSVTNIRLRYSLNLHKSEIADILKRMTQKGLLVSEGYGRGMHYLLPPKSPDIMNIAPPEANVVTSTANEATSPQSKENNRRVKQRLSSEEMKLLIINICNDWISLEELAERINRNATYLRIHNIPPLIKDKSLEMLYPGTPNHPNQKYKVPD